MNQKVITELLHIAHYLAELELFVWDCEDIFVVCMNIHDMFVKSERDDVMDWMHEYPEVLELDHQKRMRKSMSWIDTTQLWTASLFNMKHHLYWYNNKNSTW